MLGFCSLQATWGLPKTTSHTGTRTRQTQAMLFVRFPSRRAFSRPGVRGLTLRDRSSIWDKFKTPMGAAPPRRIANDVSRETPRLPAAPRFRGHRPSQCLESISTRQAVPQAIPLRRPTVIEPEKLSPHPIHCSAGCFRHALTRSGGQSSTRARCPCPVPWS